MACDIVSAKDVKARPLTDEEAKTWCGTAVAGEVPAAARNNPDTVGFDLPGASVLLGNAKDNPLVAHLTKAGMGAKTGVLPYKPSDDFPGRGHGYIAWNLMSLGHDLETVACIADDADGMNEAVGTLFQLAVGIDTLTPYVLPASGMVAAATEASLKPAAAVVWQAAMPDTIWSLAMDGANVVAVSWDGTQTTFDAKGAVTATKADVTVPAPAKPAKDVAKLPKEKIIADLAVKQVLAGDGLAAVAYLGGMLQIFAADGSLKAQQMMPQDVTAMVWSGNTLIVGLAEGQVIALTTK